jgi:hypothetical protein
MASESSPNYMVETISSLLQQVENQLAAEEQIGIKIPWGVIRRVADILPDYNFISDQTIRRNICYAVEALDFYRWLINRFQLYGPVEAYLYKTGIILVNMIVEAMTRDFLLRRNKKPTKKHSKNIEKLEEEGIPEGLCTEMRALNSRRGNVHLHLISELEAEKYELRDWNLSMLCLQNTRKVFREMLRGGIK